MSRRPFVPPAQWTDPRHRRGLAGERAALAYLVACGWEPEAHRFRASGHEVDLVVRRGRTVAFVEVKTRASLVCGTPAEAVGWRKRRAIAVAAECWRLRFGRPGDEYRFDLVSVQRSGAGRWVVDHVPDAWRLDSWMERNRSRRYY
jgi:putative endonuclease